MAGRLIETVPGGGRKMNAVRLRLWLRRLGPWLFSIGFVSVLLQFILLGLSVDGRAFAAVFWVWPLVFAAMMAGLLLDFAIICVHDAELRRIAAHGIPAKAAVLKIERTGIGSMVSGEYVRYRLEVRPPDAPPFQVESDEVFFGSDKQAVAPGKVVDVMYDPGTQAVAIPEELCKSASGD
jgi:hypothetical protein